MPIQEQNIKFLASQVMDDVPEGGGAATGNEIPDGEMNNVYPDISDLDRAMGRFNLRKLFLAVRTLSTDLFGGAKTVVTALPEDPAIGYTLFTTDAPFDTREQAANRVEAYLFKGPMWHGALYENHIEGMRQIRIIQRDESTTLPPRGKTLCLVQNEGEPGEKEQYVRVTDVSAEMQTFTGEGGQPFQRLIVSLDLSDALRFDFTGHQVNEYDNYNYNIGARLRDTTVADATRYFGAQYLQAAASIGDYSVRAQSMFTQLVPAAQSEEPVTNQSLNPEIIRTINAGTRDVEAPQQAHSWARTITPENRSRNIVQTLSPIPAPGSLTFSFMAQGNFYTLTDNGEGQLSGSDPSIGVGTIDYTTGAVSITMGALPDVGSSVIGIFASPVHFQKLAGHADIDATITLEQSVGEPIKPGSLTLTWLVDGVTKTATAAANGTISGDATGYASHVAGEFVLELTTPPDPQTKLGADYERQTAETLVFNGLSETDGMVSLNVGEAVEPGTMEAEWYSESVTKRDSVIVENRMLWVPGKRTNTESTTRRYHNIVSDDGTGGWAGSAGAVDYQNGSATLGVLPDVMTEQNWSSDTGEWRSSSNQSGSEVTRFATGTVTVRYVPAGAAATAVSTELDLPPLQIRVLPRLLDILTVQGSVEFIWNGKTYIDRQGAIYTDIQANGSGTPVGSMDYLSGTATLDDYDTGSGAVEVTSLLGVYGDWFTGETFFRAPSAPLIPQSLQVLATTIEGEQISATSDQDGNIVGDRATGQINYQYGTAEVAFGQLVDDSTLTAEEKAESWYDPANVNASGMIWRPTYVQPSTMRYNAVAVSYLPLDADIVGIDAVRLPADGRVPIYRKGDVVMIMHPQDSAPQTVANGDTIATRPRLAWVRVLDADGDQVTTGYTLDRATGNVTFDDVTGIIMPITVRHTVGDLRLVTDVQITGDITVSRPLTHDYPAGETIVASCLIHGDRRARVSATWDEETWNGTWADARQGDEATATLNTIDHPITVTNEGCDTDRWLFRCTNASTNAWELISEKRGLVWSGTYTQTGDDVAPINPRTRGEDGAGGVPYMTIPAAANGGGWNTGNVIRINTVGAIADFWIARAIQQSDEPLDEGADGCEIYALGNIDRP
ncbi:hypothetical protein [Marinobacter oulmenensis]|uniref:Uncharacterized protein n=1 Tax=Marinobacter oulmenensis TaxID=643747 RepID=A0A840UFT2_9GAMM|nr:hypothetical protein [Marinobacter oulmenensis]MBB5322340.1 hypothetical protein [Marinobacter oulmenensis]